MPLPVERSQGSVSALVARFQTAANRDLEAEKARESRRASLQPSSTSSANNSRRTSSIWSGGIITPSPGSTPKLGGAAVLPNVDQVDEKDVGNGSRPAIGEEGVRDKGDDKDSTTTMTVKDVTSKAGDNLGKVENKLERLIINDQSKDEGSPDKNKDNAQIKDGINQCPSRPPKSPKRLSSTNVMSALPIPGSTSTNDAKSSQPEPSEDRSANKENEGEGQIAVEKETKPVQDKHDTPSKSAPAKRSPSQTMSAKKPYSTPSATPSSKTPFTTSTSKPNPIPNTNSNTKIRSRLSSGPSSSPNTTSTSTPTARARTSLGHQTPTSTSTRTSSKKPTPSSTIPPPPARTPKPLIPSHTGPARRPSSSAHTRTSTDTSVPSPLKPHLTGTPSKPTASSLAKARIPSGSGPFSPSTPSSTSTTSAKKRESISGQGRTTGSTHGSSIGGRGNSLSPSPSPGLASKTEKQEGTPSKFSSVSSTSGSRLLQGTAASRARSAGVQHQHHDSSSTASPSTATSTKTPSKTSTNTPSKTTVNNNTKTPGRSDQVKTSSSSSTSTSRVRVRSTPQADKTQELSGSKDSPKTPSVGKSPIGRLGLAAANIKRPEGPSIEKGEISKQEGIIDQDNHREVGIKDDTKTDDKDKIDDIAKEELQDLTTKSDGVNNTDVVDDPIERPKTPSPKLEISNEALESLPHNESETPQEERSLEGNEIEVEERLAEPEEKGIEKKDEDQKNDEVITKDHGNRNSVEIGDESLEEIPDIE